MPDACTPLYERYRPRRLSDFCGHGHAIAQLQKVAARGLGGRLYWIQGPSGVGKTSLARWIADQIAEPLYVHEIDAQQLTPVALRDYQDEFRLYALGKGGRALIVNEAHGLRADVLRQILVWAEPFPRHCVLIFTTTDAGAEQIGDRLHDFQALLSRCVLLQLDARPAGLPARVKEIAAAEGLDGQPLEAYERLAVDCEYNARAMLQRVEQGYMSADGPPRLVEHRLF